MSAPKTQRAWVKDEQGNHIAVCAWKPNETDRMTALWLKFWRWLDERGLGYELRTVRTLCPCGFSIEECPCSFDERIAHEVTA